MSFQFKGVALPWAGTLRSFLEIKSDEDILKTAIQMILLTRKGERVMLRDFGSDLEKKVFDPNDKMLRMTIVSEIKEAVRRWDDRIGIESMDVVQQDHVFSIQLVFYNAKDPLRTPKTFSVSLGEIA